MNSSTLRDVLERSGLTQYEADAYLTLVERGSATAVEIAERSDVPQARIYDILRELESRDYVELYQEGTLRAEASDPSDVVDEITEQAKLMTAAADELEERWQEPNDHDRTVGVVTRFRTVLDHAREAIESAEYEVEIATPLEQYEQLRDVLTAAFERGVVVKVTITPASSNASIDDLEEHFAGTTTEVRHCRLPTPFLVLADRSEVCFAPMERRPNGREYGVLVDDYSLSQIFDWYYQTAIWESWEVLYSAREEGWPATYTDMRSCLVDIAPHVDAGRDVRVYVEGRDRTTGSTVTLAGRATDVTSIDVEDGPSLAAFAQEANFVLETDDDRYEIGGWGALLEDVEAYRIVVEDVREN
ncbi:TrmB family transcriptional regulator [Natronococcus pandeyae]|uniref:TrmB family transcriptional regulator n=1 Tax=Natronococcus pandeyae TaxID=2055836 RepID=A0A8J8TNF2_9EURY|nr:TrmB family transcriptional regulator [Natronococcus pandeyae]TYL36606.1 TrmB family transcriptional regulator [Natronococcus pandeyae]